MHQEPIVVLGGVQHQVYVKYSGQQKNRFGSHNQVWIVLRFDEDVGEYDDLHPKRHVTAFVEDEDVVK